MIPIFIFFATFIVFPKQLFTHLPDGLIFSTYLIDYDFFTWWKAFFTLLLAIFLLMLMLFSKSYKIIFHKHKVIFLIVSLIFSTLSVSTFLSGNKFLSLFGYFSLNQGFILETSYLFIFIYFVIQAEYKLKFIINILLFFLFVFIFICIVQHYSDHYFIKYVSDIYKGITKNFQFEFIKTGTSRLIFPFANQNYFGSFVSLFMPLTFGLYFYCKNRLKKFVLFFLSCGTFSVAILSQSRAGYIGIFFAIFFLVVCLRRIIILKWKSFVVLFLGYFIVLFSFHNSLFNRFQLTHSDISRVTSHEKIFNYTFYTDKNNFVYSNKNAWLRIQYTNNRLYFLNFSNQLIPFKIQDNTINIYSNQEYYFLLKRKWCDGLKNCIEFIDIKNDKHFLLTINENKFYLINPELGTFYTSILGANEFAWIT